jgi:type I restriction enzyme, S subunit
MREGSEMKKLGEVCEIKHGYAFKSSDFEDDFSGSKPIVLTPGNFSEEGGLYFTEKNTKRCINGYSKEYEFLIGDLIVVMTDLSAKMKILGKPAIIKHKNILHNQRIGRFLFFNNSLNEKYLFYYLLTDGYLKNIKETATGTMVRHTAPKRILDNEILIPPLGEQQHIVSILDKAFAAIDKAKANTEKNLNNAKELFQSQLNGYSSKKEKLASLVNIVTGKLNSNAAVENGQYPFFTCSREIFHIDTFAFNTEAILLAGNNAVGDFNVKHYKGKFNAYQRTYVLTVKDERCLNYRFLYYQIERSLASFKDKSVGAATKFLKLPIIQNFEIDFPSLTEQQKIVFQLNALSTETKKLETLYQKKLAELEDLKKSILEKAFKGELTERRMGEMAAV